MVMMVAVPFFALAFVLFTAPLPLALVRVARVR